MSTKVVPPPFERCHWTVGIGSPDDAAAKEKGEPAATVTGAGWVVTAGATWAEVTWTSAVYRSKEELAPAGLSPVEFELSAHTRTRTPAWKARPV